MGARSASTALASGARPWSSRTRPASESTRPKSTRLTSLRVSSQQPGPSVSHSTGQADGTAFPSLLPMTAARPVLITEDDARGFPPQNPFPELPAQRRRAGPDRPCRRAEAERPGRRARRRRGHAHPRAGAHRTPGHRLRGGPLPGRPAARPAARRRQRPGRAGRLPARAAAAHAVRRGRQHPLLPHHGDRAVVPDGPGHDLGHAGHPAGVRPQTHRRLRLVAAADGAELAGTRLAARAAYPAPSLHTGTAHGLRRAAHHAPARAPRAPTRPARLPGAGRRGLHRSRRLAARDAVAAPQGLPGAGGPAGRGHPGGRAGGPRDAAAVADRVHAAAPGARRGG